MSSEWVNKIWGSEQWLVNNELYCCKQLFLHAGFQCSFHRHHIKDETFYVMDAATYNEVKYMKMEVGDDILYPLSGDSIRIPPGTWHRFSNTGSRTVVIIEVSTHHDDADVERKEESRKI